MDYKAFEGFFVDPQYCKQLNKLGLKTDTYYIWCIFAGMHPEGIDSTIVLLDTRVNDTGFPNEAFEYLAPAYSQDDILELLPNALPSYGYGGMFLSNIGIPADGKWEVVYRNPIKEIKLEDPRDKKLPNAMAKMLIYLLENKIIEIKKDGEE